MLFKALIATVSILIPCSLWAQVSITLSPAQVTLTAGQTQLFTPVIGGTTNLGTSWDQGVNNAGFISGVNGTLRTLSYCFQFCTNLYTAPAVISAPVDIAVVVGSLGDSTQHFVAVVHLSPGNACTPTCPPPPVVGPVVIEAYQLVNGVKQDIDITLDGSLQLVFTTPTTAILKLAPIHLFDTVQAAK